VNDKKNNITDYDNLDLTPVMSQYVSVKKAYADYLLFFRMGDFYELFFEDAEIVSNLLDLTLTQRDKLRGGIPMCGMPHHVIDTYIGKLVKLGYKIAICDQTETPDTKAGKGPLKREITRVITPGTVVDENLLEKKENNFLLSIFIDKKRSIAFSFIDLSTSDFFIQSADFNEFPALLAKIDPKEMLIPDFLYEDREFLNCMDDWKSNWRLFIRPMPSALFDYKSSEKVLVDFYKIHSIDSLGKLSENEIKSSGMLFDYIFTIQGKNLGHVSYPKVLRSDKFVQIDSFTAKSLDIFSTTSSLKSANLIDTIDFTSTAAGRRLLFSYLSSPLTDVNQINDRLNAVEFLIDHSVILENLQNLLKRVPDFSRVMSRILLGKWSLKDISAIKTGLMICDEIKEFFLKQADSMEKNDNYISAFIEYKISADKTKVNRTFDDYSDYYADEGFVSFVNKINIPSYILVIVKRIGDYRSILSDVLHCVKEMDIPVNLDDGDFIERGFSEELDQTRDFRAKIEAVLENMQNEYKNLTQISTLKIKKNQMFGYYIEIPQSQESKVPYSFIKKQSTLNTIKYTTPELSQLEFDINNTDEKIYKLQFKIIVDIIDKITEIKNEIYSTADAISQIDVICSFAVAAIKFNYVRPVLDDSEDLIIKDGRHPIVENHLMKHNKQFIPNDCDLTHENRFWLLTGPNMAGKSTFLRQNAIIIIMAQIGSFVPASYAKIGYVNKIFTRIGAYDDLSHGKSTFMVEMIETANILRKCRLSKFYYTR
jgi:DNA mismatch repair protein MutS